MLLARGALELIFVRKNAKTQKSLSEAYVFDSRRAFVGNGKIILQWQRDYREQTLQTLCFVDDTKRACPSDHGKRSIFLFRENAEK
jgi:hypothetical protein